MYRNEHNYSICNTSELSSSFSIRKLLDVDNRIAAHSSEMMDFKLEKRFRNILLFSYLYCTPIFIEVVLSSRCCVMYVTPAGYSYLSDLL